MYKRAQVGVLTDHDQQPAEYAQRAADDGHAARERPQTKSKRQPEHDRSRHRDQVEQAHEPHKGRRRGEEGQSTVGVGELSRVEAQAGRDTVEERDEERDGGGGDQSAQPPDAPKRPQVSVQRARFRKRLLVRGRR